MFSPFSNHNTTEKKVSDQQQTMMMMYEYLEYICTIQYPHSARETKTSGVAIRSLRRLVKKGNENDGPAHHPAVSRIPLRLTITW
jgi:hypothetical protein